MPLWDDKKNLSTVIFEPRFFLCCAQWCGSNIRARMHKHIELGFLLVPDYISILNVLLRSIPSLISPQNHTIIMLHGDHIKTIVKRRPYLREIPLWFMNIWDVIATIRLVFNASNFLRSCDYYI